MATPPDFTTGSVLTAAQMNKVGLWLVKQQTIGSAVSSVTVTGAFSADYDNYQIIVSGVSLSVAANTMNYRNHDGTNPVTTNYNWGMARVDLAASTVAASASALGDRIAIGVGTGDKFGQAFDVLMPYQTAYTLLPFISGINQSTGYAYTGSAMHQTAASYTAFNIFPNSGTMTGGSICVYGYNNG